MGHEPWDRRAWWRLGILASVGLAGVAFSWWFLSSSDSFRTQQRWLAVGVLSETVALVGFVDWLTSAMRATKAAQRRLSHETAEVLRECGLTSASLMQGAVSERTMAWSQR